MLDSIYRANDHRTFAFSAENPTGEKAGGARGGDCTKLRPNVCIHPGETVTLVDVTGSGVIESMWFTGYSGHSFVLRMYWEGNEAPSVEAPLSAFFGCAYDENLTDTAGKYLAFRSAVMMVSPSRAYNCYFPMPFHRRCRITMENRGAEEQWLYYAITGAYTADLPPESETLYFHASYRQAHPVTKGKSYTVIDGIRGRGKFLGVTLASGMNGNNTCWVEGEVRMYLDGDEYPSIHYTGTEDYFCGSYAFGNDAGAHTYQTYDGPYAGMFAVMGNPAETYNAQQRFLLYRFHVPDPICFTQDFRMTIDNLGWTGPRYDDYTSVAYWYQTLPFAALAPLPTDDECIMK